MNDPMSLASSHQAVASGERLMSLDALRGFDMMWIVGADALGHALANVDAGPVVKTIATQLDHVPWAGFRFYDLIFPLFVFMIGVAVTFSLGRLVERQGRSAAVVRILRRTCLLYLLGLFYYASSPLPNRIPLPTATRLRSYLLVALLGVIPRRSGSV